MPDIGTWLGNYRACYGIYTVTVEGGQDIDTLNFGNRETTPGEFLGTVDSLWSNPANWGYGGYRLLVMLLLEAV